MHSHMWFYGITHRFIIVHYSFDHNWRDRETTKIVAAAAPNKWFIFTLLLLQRFTVVSKVVNSIGYLVSWNRKKWADKGELKQQNYLHTQKKRYHNTLLYRRAELERLQLMSLLDTSFKKNHCSGLESDEVTNELSHHLRELRDEVYFWVVLQGWL